MDGGQKSSSRGRRPTTGSAFDVGHGARPFGSVESGRSDCGTGRAPPTEGHGRPAAELAAGGEEPAAAAERAHRQRRHAKAAEGPAPARLACPIFYRTI